MTYIVLLRGINVGGHRKLPMTELKVMLIDMGFKNVKTYIQSGNIVLESQKNTQEISESIAKQILAVFGYTIPVICITKENLIWIYKNNPFLNSETDIKTLHVIFLNQIPSLENTKTLLDIPKYKNDYYIVSKNCIYLHTPDGYAKTKFSNDRFEKALNCIATTRNWRTTSKLFNMVT